MRLLLDTHVFIWFNSCANKLSTSAYDQIMKEGNELYLSMASLWEIQIKHQLGKLALDRPLEKMIAHHQTENQLQVLPIEARHVYGLAQLPSHHRDPFDRLLISQAKVDGYQLVTKDQYIHTYADYVEVFW